MPWFHTFWSNSQKSIDFSCIQTLDYQDSVRCPHKSDQRSQSQWWGCRQISFPAANLWNKITEIFAGELSQTSFTKIVQESVRIFTTNICQQKSQQQQNNYVITSCENLVVNLPLQGISTRRYVPRPQFSVAPPRSWNRARQRHAFPDAPDPRDPRNASTSKDGISKLTCEKNQRNHGLWAQELDV